MKTNNLTKEQIKKLETIRANMRRAKAHLTAPDVMGLARKIDPDKALGNAYLVKNPACCETMTNTPPAVRLENHQIGSDIVGLYNALQMLEEFLNPPPSLLEGV